MVYNGTSHLEMDDLGVPGNLQMLDFMGSQYKD